MNLKDLRKLKNVTQTEIAKSLGIKQSSVAMWESGASRPQTKDLRKIADVLGVSVEQLLDCFEK